MKRQVLLLLVAPALPLATRAQATITSSDFFNQPGLYYRAHANRYDSLDITGGTAYVVPSGLIGSAGGNQFWDFSSGPTDRVLRFDYLNTAGIPQAFDFPDATLVERMTDESDNSEQFLFFQQIPGAGRKVYGFYADNPLFTPSNVFQPPIVDFPDRITFNQEWNTSTTYESVLSISDPDPESGGLFDFGQRITQSSHFKVDAWGTAVLPDEIGGFGDALRINEDVTLDFAYDFGDGQFEHFETDYARNYYWVMPGYGIVAQLNSTQNSSPQPDNFSRATSFLRLFETNKKITVGGGCTEPDPVTGFRIRVSNKTILLTWDKADCATSYQMQCSTNRMDPFSWKPLGAPSANTFFQGENTGNGPMRFYRVQSIK